MVLLVLLGYAGGVVFEEQGLRIGLHHGLVFADGGDSETRRRAADVDGG